MSTEPKIDVDLQTLLVKQVSALVEAPAEALHGNSDEQIRTMALLYRVLAANCVEKAQMAEAFGPPPAPEEDDDD